MTTSPDFGYPWWLSYGHLTLAIPATALFAWGVKRRWTPGKLVLTGALALWAFTAFGLMRFGFDVGSVPPLPTQTFLRAGSGRVLDIGAGTGRSSIMVLRDRPQASLVALDLFGASFDQHFAPGQSPQDRLMANLRAAGVADRASIVAADMRKIPFPDATFDAVVSAYAVDHLGREGSKQALVEAARVLKPGGELLLILVNGRDGRLRVAFGPLLAHGGFRGAGWWQARVAEAGLRVTESGNTFGTFYVLGSRCSGPC